MDITIRNIDIYTDIQGIMETHGSDEHWGSEQSCFMSQKTRLENNFYIQVAISNDKVIGHAEWIVSREPNSTFLYLGMLQVKDGYQKEVSEQN